MLGTFAVRSGQRDLTPASGHPSTLLKLLALRGTMTVDAAIDALWPDADIDTGRARLRNTMNRLRGKAGACIERRGESLELAEGVRCDIDAFERAAAEALAGDPSMRIGLARQAISLYTGELLPGDAFEDWAAAPRERMLRRYVALIDLVANAAGQEGNYDEAARLLDLGVTADPLDERRYVRLGQVLLTQGRVAAARQVAERGVAVLDELGLPPGPELSRLRG
jgi:DNA-binding SARP family transcriptional activator